MWTALTEYLNRPIQSEAGYLLSVDATAIDMAGHRTEDVKHWVRQALVRRPMAIQGAIPNNAPVLGKPRLLDVTRNGRTDGMNTTFADAAKTDVASTLLQRRWL